jgi:hypothetical protein
VAGMVRPFGGEDAPEAGPGVGRPADDAADPVLGRDRAELEPVGVRVRLGLEHLGPR